MAQYDAVAIVSKEDIVDSMYTLCAADGDLVAALTPGGVYKRVFPDDLPPTSAQAGRNSWAWIRILLRPDRGIPVSWDTQSKVHLLVEAQTQRVSTDDNPGRRLEIIQSKVLQIVGGKTPHASMVLGFALTEGPTTFEFRETSDLVFSDAIYQCVIN